jgi:hypothetical protein
MMIGFDFCAVRGPWLEYANRWALRAHLAGLTMVGTSFGDGKRESPPSAASAKAYRARALTSTVLHAGLSDLPSRYTVGERIQIIRGGRSAFGRNYRTFSGQPSVSAALPPVEFESARVIGRRIVTDRNCLSRNCLSRNGPI